MTLLQKYPILTSRIPCRCYCSNRKLTNAEVRQKRSELFESEKKRQLSLTTRIEKIQVKHKGPPEDCTLIMNKGVSTPFNCAMHIQELLMNRSALALVSGKPWDMHSPLVEDCELQFLHFKDEDPRILNMAFWRTGSFVLGHVLETAFKDMFYVELCSFPRPDVKTGSFIYDVDLKMDDWQPSVTELRCLSQLGAKLYHEDLRFERLDIDASLALQMFEHNRFKVNQIPAIAEKSRSGSSVTVYKMGDHVDISRGPLIASTSHIGRFNVTAVHDVKSPDFGQLQRVQAIAMPTQLRMHYWSYDVLVRQAAKLNSAPVPTLASPSKARLEITEQ